MDFYRRTLMVDPSNSEYVKNLLTNFGFTLVNEQYFTGTTYLRYRGWFKPKGESGSTCLFYSVGTGGDAFGDKFYLTANENDFNPIAGTGYCSNNPNPSVIIYIPLKNNYFLLEQYNPASSSFYTPGFMTSHFHKGIYIDNMLSANSATINLNFKNNSLNKMGYFQNNLNGINTYAGLRSVIYYYDNRVFQSNPVRTGDYEWSYNPEGILKFLNRRDKDYPDSSWEADVINPCQYNNVNQNICTLIRVPQDNTFLDGLFLCTTYPYDQIEGKVFSFNGRNFLGVYENLVVELPAN